MNARPLGIDKVAHMPWKRVSGHLGQALFIVAKSYKCIGLYALALDER